VVLTGKQKAAMLLMGLDAATATELLKDVNPELVQELALELAHLDAVGYHGGEQSTQIARQFCNSLQSAAADKASSLGVLPKGIIRITDCGDDKRLRSKSLPATLMAGKVKDIHKEKNPFKRISVLDSRVIASVLRKEHPRTAAVVISELPANKSTCVLELLGAGVRLSAVGRMHTCKNMTMEAKTHIAQTICERLSAWGRLTADAVTEDEAGKTLQTRPEMTLGKMALIMQKLGERCRGRLSKIRREKGKKTGEKLQTQFTQAQTAISKIAWNDIPQIDNDLLQKALKGVDVKKLAFALFKAGYAIVQKITSNISESAAAAMREQTSRILKPRNKEVEDARGEIVRILHQMKERNKVSYADG
jgi:flagellar motor switch protein FliG